MSKIRRSAKGQTCQIRLPGICCRNPETTVLAHYRLPGHCGTGIKPPDYMAAYACSSCHDAVDGRIKTTYDRQELKAAHAEGVMRTLYLLEKQELIRVP